jgi:phosphoserine phosphatase
MLMIVAGRCLDSATASDDLPLAVGPAIMTSGALVLDGEMFTATLIAAETLSAGDFSAAADIIRTTGAAVEKSAWIEPAKAADLHFVGNAEKVRAALEHSINSTDVIVQRTSERRRRLLVADMDSTMITVECIDELADYAGLKHEIAEVTERAMRGELDFEAALRNRVALLEGLDEAVIDQCLAERVVITPGAKALVRTLKAKGGMAVLVSGGFTRFAEPVAREIGFDQAIANHLGVERGRLTGRVDGEIIGAAAKRSRLLGTLSGTGWTVADTLAVGDGANDIPMIEAAGLGVAYHAKPKTAAAASARIDHCDLSAILYAMGYPKAEWADA